MNIASINFTMRNPLKYLLLDFCQNSPLVSRITQKDTQNNASEQAHLYKYQQTQCIMLCLWRQLIYNTVHPTVHVHMTKHNMQIPLLQTTTEHASHSKALSSTGSVQAYCTISVVGRLFPPQPSTQRHTLFGLMHTQCSTHTFV